MTSKANIHIPQDILDNFIFDEAQSFYPSKDTAVYFNGCSYLINTETKPIKKVQGLISKVTPNGIIVMDLDLSKPMRYIDKNSDYNLCPDNEALQKLLDKKKNTSWSCSFFSYLFTTFNPCSKFITDS